MVGLSQAAFDLTLDYLHERQQFGQRVADFQGVQFQYANVGVSALWNESVRAQKVKKRRSRRLGWWCVPCLGVTLVTW